MGTIKSTWAGTPITLDDQIEDAVWAGAQDKKMAFDGGFMLAKNDAKYLYVILDVIKDTHNDPTGDYFWFTFDRNRNKAITPNYDVNYGTYPGNPNKIGRQYYKGAGRWTGLLNEEQKSECRSTFGTSPNSDTPHRIWKFRFRLTDLKVNLLWWWFSSYTKFGFRVHSKTPNLNYDTPTNFFRDFSKLHTLYFSRKPSISSSDLGPIMGSVGLIPTTKINASGRATTASNYFIHAQNAAFGGRLNVIGNRTKMDQLPGIGAKKYKVFHRKGASGGFSEFVTSWYNYKWNGSDYVLEAASADSNNFYKMPSAGVDYSIDDLLFQFNSTKLSTGIHQFKVKFYNNAGTEVGATNPEQILTMYIDNNVPEVSINSVKYKNAEVGACGIVNLQNPTDKIDIDFEAFDKEGNLLDYSLRARWGEGDSQSIVYKKYNAATTPGNWNGSHHILGSFNAQTTCAHSFNIYARARTTNGYGYIGKNSTYRYVTIIK
ncbi:hypothetical protein U8527_18200 [Kordia algicida OT-1]|uniref:Uncharacterized protein n=1 Tax=Kordia algicida OT-1 TaxID=391587 RepID=A9DIL0_9FLAO|nr:hypothetical protein [Kordia algicida]EDP97925.1 hypothetical protein KAOT1_11947 [Kordia algicida OT-1]